MPDVSEGSRPAGHEPARPVGAARVRYDADRDAWLLHRPARTWPAAAPGESPRLPPPPEVPDPEGSSVLTTLLPLLGSLGIVAFALVVRSLVYLLVAAFMVTAIVGGAIASRVVARRRERHRRARVRRDYAHRVAEARARSWRAACVARDALNGLYPDTAGLLTAVRSHGALWERRSGDADFAHVRLGLGRVPAPAPVVMDGDAGPVGAVREVDLAADAEEAVTSSAFLEQAPVVIPLRGLSSVAVVGDLERGRDLTGAWLASLGATCAPTDLRMMGLVSPGAAPAWDWAKWLPHTRDPLAGDGFGRAARALVTDAAGFGTNLRDLVTTRLEQERRAAESSGWSRAAGAPAVAAEHVVVLVDHYDPIALAELAPALEVVLVRGADLAVTVVLLVEDGAAVPSTIGACVDLLADGTARFRESGPDAPVRDGVQPDALDRAAAESLARLIAPFHLADADSDSDLVDTVRLVELLGYESFDQVEPGDWLRAEQLLASGSGTSPPVDDQGSTSAEPLDDQPGGRGPDDLLATPIGIRSDGSRLVLDLKEAAAGGMGPHGMLVGATGSGKSELLRSLVAGLAAGHDPALLNVLLVDFKGGAAFAELAALPHTTGLITNLADDLSLVDRMRASLAGELERRQQLLRDAGNLESISSYHELRAAQPELPDLPYLLVVVDEFGELLAARPEFIEVFVAIGRLGRSLGIHLLLSTQRLEEGRIRGLESHLRYRICLRTYSGAESTTVIGVPDAHALPPLPGLGYLRVDAELVRFKAATTSLAHRPVLRSSRAPAVVLPFTLDRGGAAGQATEPVATPVDHSAPEPSPADLAAGSGPVRTELRALVDRLSLATSSGPRRVWLPPLPDVVQLADLPMPHGRHRAPTGPPTIAIGLVDDPARQAQHALQLDLSGSGGHVACVGSPRTGKTTFLRTMVEALVEGTSPADVSLYLLDLGGGLHGLAEVAHVGAVAGRHDPDAVGRLIRELRAVVDERAAAFRACGVSSLQDLRRHPDAAAVLPDPLAAEVFLLVDNIGVLRNEFTELDLALADLASTSLQFGVHVVVTAGRWLDIRPALLDAIGNRIELRLNDPVDSLAGRRLAETVPVDRPGRGILRDGRHVLLALPPDRPSRERWEVRAPRVQPLPGRLTVDDVPGLAAAAGRPVDDQNGLLLGVGEFRLAPQLVDLTAAGSHLLVFGDEGSGRTTLLRRAVDHLAGGTDPSQVRLHLVDLGRGLLDRADLPAVEHYAFTSSLAEAMANDLLKELIERLPPPDLDRRSLLERTWWSGPEHVLVVDDYELTLAGPQGPLTPLAEAIPYARDIGLHVVLARRVAGASRSAFEPFGQRLRELTPAALLLDGERSEGPLVGERTASRQPPGRGLLVRRGAPDTVVQLALPAGSVTR